MYEEKNQNPSVSFCLNTKLMNRMESKTLLFPSLLGHKQLVVNTKRYIFIGVTISGLLMLRKIHIIHFDYWDRVTRRLGKALLPGRASF